MTITIKDFLDIPVVKGAKVRTAINTSSIHPIQSVSVIEIPVENFIRKNELVLSTAIGCTNDTEIFKEFIYDVYKSEASALVVAVGHHVKEIPEEVIEYAESLQFPIIEIPWDIRFSDIIEAVYIRINNIRQDSIKCFEDLQKQLLTYYLNGFNLSDAAELIRQRIGSPAVIANISGELKGVSNKSKDFVNTLTPFIHRLLSDVGEDSLEKPNVEKPFTTFRIQSGNILYGYLFLKSMPSDTLEEDHNKNTNIVRHIVTPITLWFNRDQAIYETEMSMRDDFVWSLAKEDTTSWEDMSSKAESMGYNLSHSYVCIVGLLENIEEAHKSEKSTSYGQWLHDNVKQDNIKIIKTRILQIGSYLKRDVMITYKQDKFIIFLQTTENDSKDITNKFLDLVEEKLKKLYKGITLSWGIGENHIGSKVFHKSFTDATIALEVCYNVKGPGHRSTHHKNSIYRMLSALANNKEVQEMVTFTIGNLIEYDTNHGLELIDTFKAYNQNKGNVSQTARALHLHRQSLLYRLKKIETITNLSLEDSDDLFLLNICIRIWSTQANKSFKI